MGVLLAWMVHFLEPGEQPEKKWTSYPTLSDTAGQPLLGQHVQGNLPLSYLLFQGILLGGGFGSLVGTIAAGTGAILRTMGQAKKGG